MLRSAAIFWSLKLVSGRQFCKFSIVQCFNLSQSKSRLDKLRKCSLFAFFSLVNKSKKLNLSEYSCPTSFSNPSKNLMPIWKAWKSKKKTIASWLTCLSSKSEHMLLSEIVKVSNSAQSTSLNIIVLASETWNPILFFLPKYRKIQASLGVFKYAGLSMEYSATGNRSKEDAIYQMVFNFYQKSEFSTCRYLCPSDQFVM